MIAIQTLWTAPRMKSRPDHPFSATQFMLEPYEILTVALATLLWRQHSGPVRLYTDSLGYEYLSRLGITDLWDGGIDTTVLDTDDRLARIHPHTFWAAAKLFAYQAQTIPFVSLDLDSIVWMSLTSSFRADTHFAHYEAVRPPIYVGPEDLRKPAGYRFDDSFDWAIPAANTSIVYFGNQNVRDEYTAESIRYMSGIPAECIVGTVPPEEVKLFNARHMVFAEQRLLSMCGRRMGARLEPLLPEIYDYGLGDRTATWLDLVQPQGAFQHVWGKKSWFRDDPRTSDLYCRHILRCLGARFPAELDRITSISSVRMQMARE